MMNEGNDEMTNQEQMMYGMSVEQMNKEFDWSLRMMGSEMTAISILSDAQEVMARGDTERARKFINIAKKILIDSMEAQRAARAA